MAIFDAIRENIGTAGQFTADIAKRTAESIRLREQIRRDRREIRLLTFAIGETYLRLHEDDFEEEYREFIDGIAVAKDDIEEKTEKLAQLKIKPEVPEDDFDDDDDEEWDDLFETTEETVTEVAQAAEEKVEEVAEEVEEAAEEVAEAVEE